MLKPALRKVLSIQLPHTKEPTTEYLRNPKFRQVIDSAYYVYAEGHYCLDDSRYVVKDHLGFKHLTSYAREHMDECCLVFEIKYDSRIGSFFNGVLHKGRENSRGTIQ